MKKVTSIVLNNFINDNRVLKENISLQNAGYDVIVVALHEEGLKEFDSIENISVHRIKLISRKWAKNKLIQLFKYLEFLYRSVKKYKHSDILHCNDLTALPVGVIIKSFFNRNAKIVYDAHEYETEINGLSNFKKSLMRILEKSLIRYVDSVITVSDAIAQEYVKLYNITKPDLILNTPIYQERNKKDIFRKVFNISKAKTIFLYQGGISSGRGIEILLDTFIKMDDKVIVFMGNGALEGMVQKAAEKYHNIYFHDAVASEILLDYTSSADFGLLFYENNCLNHYYCSPNKMFEYIMAEIPIIVSNLYEMKRLVESNHIGIVAKNNTHQSLTIAIKEIIQLDRLELQRNIQKVKKIYHWENQEKKLLKVYGDLDVNKEKN